MLGDSGQAEVYNEWRAVLNHDPGKVSLSTKDRVNSIVVRCRRVDPS